MSLTRRVGRIRGIEIQIHSLIIVRAGVLRHTPTSGRRGDARAVFRRSRDRDRDARGGRKTGETR